MRGKETMKIVSFCIINKWNKAKEYEQNRQKI